MALLDYDGGSSRRLPYILPYLTATCQPPVRSPLSYAATAATRAPALNLSTTPLTASDGVPIAARSSPHHRYSDRSDSRSSSATSATAGSLALCLHTTRGSALGCRRR